MWATFLDSRGWFVPNFVGIPGESDDARAVRTRAVLAQALVALMHTRAFDDISVQDLCEYAGVGRSTFYAHFEDKEEMFIRHTVVFANAMGSELSWDAQSSSYRFPVRGFFAHVRQMQPVMQSLAKSRKAEFILKIWQNNVAQRFEQRVREIRAEMQTASSFVPVSVLANHLAGTLMCLLTWWMDHHFQYDELQMDEQWHALITALG
jgi:AcrR family transcriptional regulator